jgi:long-chain acyl-CoA synthetase
LHGVELVENLVITEDQWTPQNGLVTSAQKLDRRAVVTRFKTEIEEAY